MRMSWMIALILCCPFGDSTIKVDWVIRTMEVTAYCKESCCCGDFADGITASGERAEGFLVAAPPQIPFGTLLLIDGYAGGAVVAVRDRGGAIKGDKLDLLFPSHREALEWGRRIIDVKIMKVR